MMHVVRGTQTSSVVDFGELSAPAAPTKPAPTKPAPSKTPAPKTPDPERREPVRPGRSPDPATHPCTQPDPSTCPAP